LRLYCVQFSVVLIEKEVEQVGAGNGGERLTWNQRPAPAVPDHQRSAS
jgi:hypothetical protein